MPRPARARARSRARASWRGRARACAFACPHVWGLLMFVHLPWGIVSGARFHVWPSTFTHAHVPVNMCVRMFWYFMHVHVCVCPSSASLLVSAGPHLILSPTFLSFVDRILSSREEVRSLRAPLMSAPSGHPVNSSELDWLNDEPRGTTAGSPAKESQWGTELPPCVSLLSREHVLPNTPPNHFSTPRAYKGLPPSLPFLLYPPHELLFILQSPVLLDPLPGHLPCPPPPYEWRTGRCWLTRSQTCG